MSSNIRTYKDLIEEKERLARLLVIQRQRVLDDWNDIKQELEPINKVFGIVGNLTTADKRNPLLNLGLKLAGNVFLKNFVLAKAGWVTKLAVPFVVKNYSSHLLADKGRSFVNNIKRWWRSRKDRE